MTNRCRTLFYAVALAALSGFAVASPVSAAGGVSGTGDLMPATVKVSKCKSAALYADRTLEFSASMNSIGTGGKLQMRMVLYRQYGEQRHFHVVTSSELPTDWYASTDPAATIYVHNLSLVPVETRAQYRLKVHFRWLDATGAPVVSATRVSRVCDQTRALPDLGVASIMPYPNAGPNYPQMPAVYKVNVKNYGGSSAATFLLTGDVNGVSLVPGPPPPATNFDFLTAKSTMSFFLYGPACGAKGGRVTVTPNPDRTVRESRYANSAWTDC